MAGTWRKVRTNAELAKVLADGDYAEIVGTGVFGAYGSATVHAYGSATVRAYGSATVRAYDSATVHAYDSATVHAYGSATVHAYGSATVHAYGSATVRASGSATVHASPYVAVQQLSMRSTVTGGVVITPPDLTDAATWCDYYGIKASRGFATLYKGVSDEYLSGYGTSYRPGEKPTALDWKPVNECGGGLHFSPRPSMTRVYCNPARFVAVKVRIADLMPIGSPGVSDKCKAPRCTVLFECDEDGNEIRSEATDAA